MFYRVNKISELDDLLQKVPDAVLIAGGTDIMAHRGRCIEETESYIDISRAEEMKTVRSCGERLFVGAAMTFTELERDPVLSEKVPLLCRVAGQVGSPQIRNLGTIGGNVANASPAADTLPVLALLNAAALVRNTAGEEREIPVGQLTTGPGKTLLRTNEYIKGFLVEPQDELAGYAYEKVGRRNALAISRLSGCCLLKMDGERMTDVHIALGAVFPSPRRLTAVEELLEGKAVSEELLHSAETLTVESIVSVTGYRKSAKYKLSVAPKLITRLLSTAMEGIR